MDSAAALNLQDLSLELPPLAPRLLRLHKADLAHAADCDSESTCIGCAHWPCCGSDDRYDLICVADDDRIAQTPKEACWQLLRAAQALRLQEVRWLLARGDDVNAEGEMSGGSTQRTNAALTMSFGRTALHAAVVGHGGVEEIGAMVVLLLAAGADPNALDAEEESPLSLAAAVGDVPTVELLLSCKRCDPNIGMCLQAAIRAKHIFPTVRKPENKNLATKRTIVEALLAGGCSPNPRESEHGEEEGGGVDAQGYSALTGPGSGERGGSQQRGWRAEHTAGGRRRLALSEATLPGHEALLVRLLKAGAAMDAVDAAGVDALRYATKAHNHDAEAILQAAGATASDDTAVGPRRPVPRSPQGRRACCLAARERGAELARGAACRRTLLLLRALCLAPTARSSAAPRATPRNGVMVLGTFEELRMDLLLELPAELFEKVLLEAFGAAALLRRACFRFVPELDSWVTFRRGGTATGEGMLVR